VKYALMRPAAATPGGRTGAVVIVHGFARDRTAHLRTLHDLAARGLIAFAADMVGLLSGESAQLRNIEGVVSHFQWLCHRGNTPGDPLFEALDPLRIALVGHSAGGAVCLEATWRLQAMGLPPTGLGLLDAVPWPRTMEEVPVRLQRLSVCSLRCEPSSWNLHNRILDLQRLLPFETVDLFLVGAAHADVERQLDPGKWHERFKYWTGLRSTTETQEAAARLLLTFLHALLLPADPAVHHHAHAVTELQATGQLRASTVDPVRPPRPFAEFTPVLRHS